MAADNDLIAHEKTYLSFTRLAKWGTITVFVIAFLVILIISR